ncbi:hypothetical protein JHK82_022511 [Glycine max]|uniref:Uncharacterized protein n=1 Tax=Glycine soja TaxID=3848 RepID=A0A0B2Q6X1_GLYSO|nr:hypothetical protein JHK87_022419 [Glycine soja]KAG5016865.1 hypothetical protein JHK85_023001 [Glycine max]KAG5026610.1 hypothetical protein JHK86_022524 [Glycine max]KAG5137780.1 hypothetical protein JHK82_022511 [Glycine max]KHN15567.1 hypothetical protein glysoja_039351 [Glycine soja]
MDWVIFGHVVSHSSYTKNLSNLLIVVLSSLYQLYFLPTKARFTTKLHHFHPSRIRLHPFPFLLTTNSIEVPNNAPSFPSHLILNPNNLLPLLLFSCSAHEDYKPHRKHL